MVTARISKTDKVLFSIKLLLTIVFISSCSYSNSPDYKLKQSVIFCIGDGMGFEQVDAAGAYLYGETGSLIFEDFPVKGSQTTYCSDSDITDSAASATAMATGRKVNKGVISRAIPGNGTDLETILEIAGKNDMSTGFVTTTAVTHATPAAFASHASDRSFYYEIFSDYMKSKYLNLMMGGGGSDYGVDNETAAQSGFEVLTNRTEMLNMDSSESNKIAGFFGDGHIPYEYDGVGTLPHLSEMAEFAFNFLDRDPDGFFLLIEGGRIDHACHGNDIERAIHEIIEFENTIEQIKLLIEDRDDIVLIVTADHETGGLEVLSENGQGSYPTVSWSTDYHTGVKVPYYIWGSSISAYKGIRDNTDYFDNIVRVMKE